jgi:hypothetical protein
MPQSLGGSDEADNLALACHRCNERHYNFTSELTPKPKKKFLYLTLVSKSGLTILSGQKTVRKFSAQPLQVELLVIASTSMMNVVMSLPFKSLVVFG